PAGRWPTIISGSAHRHSPRTAPRPDRPYLRRLPAGTGRMSPATPGQEVRATPGRERTVWRVVRSGPSRRTDTDTSPSLTVVSVVSASLTVVWGWGPFGVGRSGS